jgi:hypothetical protein
METSSDPSARAAGGRSPPLQEPGRGASAAPALVPRWTWVTVAAAAIVIVVVIAVVAGLWATISKSQISVAGWAALIFGVVVALALWIGLISLMFLSNRRGYDDL